MAHDQLLDHEYDGIQEYDNPCPGWWHAIFLLTVLFSVVYFLFFHVTRHLCHFPRLRRHGLLRCFRLKAGSCTEVRFGRRAVGFGSVIRILEIGVHRTCMKCSLEEPSGLQRHRSAIGKE